MKNITTRIAAVAVLGLLGLTVSSLQATVPSKMDFVIKYYAQGEFTELPDGSEKGAIEKGSAKTQDFLELIGEYTGVPIPEGAYIEVHPDGEVSLKDAEGTTITNLNSFVQVDLNLDESLFSGTYDPSTQKESSKILLFIEIYIGNGGPVELHMTGVAKESFKNTGANDEGDFTAKGNITAKVSGYGTVDGENLLLEGIVKFKGTETGNLGP